MIKQYNVTVNGTTYEVTVESAAGGSRMASAPVSRAAAAPVARAAAPAPAAAPAAGGPANVTSPLPGTVLRLCKNTGDTVAAGEVVMIVESMKMENEVVAPEGGRIASIAVAAGSAINTGDLLFTLG